MLRRVLFVSTLMLAGAFGFVNSAKADTTEKVIFTGGVTASCDVEVPTTATNTTTGTLIANAAKSELTTSTPAYVNVKCAGGSLSISDPLKTAGATDTTAKAVLTINSKTVASPAAPAGDGPKSLPLTAADTGDASINMTATVAAPATELAPDTYTYEVTVTATPGS
ncbi:hypothetical protein DSM106972_032390 [Dulcicalothrix desertica PCC 7102]|uniref:Spore coat protein U domain-containing protein n=1 Tax=Dulcicalothrix desertica PCC 7102 TaxID=232991 RepID=A0A3S1D9L0_9CYAN|nr:hypothetical protein [Dulcicalothrix desertica]RUT06033.1 hypothetical protein DSM106972_032390 [Dulcicalothrix desertica PCC 7102]TWH54300.1 hypothetical protein CAL7102_02319 [Dulcicalothrix desertica PCC 7102]